VRERAQGLVEAAHALAALGLVTAFGHVSARTPTGVLITPAADLADVDELSLVEIPHDATRLPPGAPAESWIHLALFRARPDVDAIARAQPPAAFAVAASTTELRPVYGQACWLGRAVPVHDDARLLRSAELAEAAAKSLPEGEALLLRGNGAITVGASPGLAVARMWLLSAACQVWTASQKALTQDEVDSWRAVQNELLPRLWRHLLRKAPA
jgi:HCOMODA/2-hydroxy-3-carboxy-muconic semialdehyde decarboxylase